MASTLGVCSREHGGAFDLAQCNGEIVNLSNIARDAGVDHKTNGSYFEILEDTLLGLMLEPWQYLRTKDDAEIDLIVERPGRPTALVEIKSTDRVEARHVRDLQRFLPDFPGAVPLCLSRDPLRRRIGDVLAVPWQEGLAELRL